MGQLTDHDWHQDGDVPCDPARTGGTGSWATPTNVTRNQYTSKSPQIAANNNSSGNVIEDMRYGV
ncbi:MAG: hypothetical protein WCF84_15950 [Anaerolineae bacterium]